MYKYVAHCSITGIICNVVVKKIKLAQRVKASPDWYVSFFH